VRPGCVPSTRQDRLNSIEHVVWNQWIEVSTFSDDTVIATSTSLDDHHTRAAFIFSATSRFSAGTT
jgi:hypothetical protein